MHTPHRSHCAASWDLHIAWDREESPRAAAHVQRREVLDRIACRGMSNVFTRSRALIRATYRDGPYTSGAGFSDEGSGDSSKSEELHSWLGYRVAEVSVSLNRIWKFGNLPFLPEKNANKRRKTPRTHDHRAAV